MAGKHSDCYVTTDAGVFRARARAVCQSILKPIYGVYILYPKANGGAEAHSAPLPTSARAVKR